MIQRLKVVKNLFLSKLDALLIQLRELSQQVKDISILAEDSVRNDGSLLKSSAYLVELQQQHTQTALDHSADLQILKRKSDRALEKLKSVDRNTQELHQKLDALHNQQQETTRNSQELDQKLDALHNQQQETTRNSQELSQQISVFQKQIRATVKTEKYPFLNPELGLMAYLYSYLPNRTAVDIGANLGDVSEYLLNVGYKVYAFEPYSPVFDKLQARLQGRQEFYSCEVAIGARDTTMNLHIAADLSGKDKYEEPSVYNSLVKHSMPWEDLQFTSTVLVSVRSLESLHLSLDIPQDIDLVKIDTEGFDLEVIIGMGEKTYPVVMAEFWNRDMAFGREETHNLPEDLVSAMRQRGYHWHIVFYRVMGSEDTAFYCNYTESLENSWGNIFFFQDYAIFSESRKWCTATLPATYFDR